jgi:hypothetical protein
LNQRGNKMADKAPEYVPSVQEYVAAFRKIEGRITAKQRKMLEEHYRSDCYITTATDLAQFAGYEKHSAGNSQYGRLVSLVSEALGLGRLGVITLALMVPPDRFAVNEWLWVMRANVAQALEELEWVEKTSDLFYPDGPVGPAEHFPD